MRTIRFMKGVIAMLAAFILYLPHMVKGYHETAT
jgi:hypothetical protein